MNPLGTLPASNSPAWTLNKVDILKLLRIALMFGGGYLVTAITPALPALETWLHAHLTLNAMGAHIDFYNTGTLGAILLFVRQWASGAPTAAPPAA